VAIAVNAAATSRFDTLFNSIPLHWLDATIFRHFDSAIMQALGGSLGRMARDFRFAIICGRSRRRKACGICHPIETGKG
jgi:hypothetical protein